MEHDTRNVTWRNRAAAALAGALSLLIGALPALAASKLDIERDIAALLEQQGLGQEVKVTLFASHNDVLQNGAASYRIREVRPDASTQKLQADVVFDTGNAERVVTFQGRYTVPVHVPVAKLRINPGDIIREEDLTWTALPSRSRHSDWVMSVEPLVGKTPTRVLLPGAPISEASVKTPDVVRKNDLVSMVYRTEYMEIRASGIAMDSGGANETIRVKNTDSNKVVQAVVLREGEVRVLSPDASPPPALKPKEMRP